jgi:hypothetical protein
MLTDLRYERWFLPLSVPFGLGPKHSDIRIDGESLHVSMGWGFNGDIPLASITAAVQDSDMVGGFGVHGFRGRWLVNGSSKGLVRLTIDPPAPAKAAGVPIKVNTLRVSVTDPDELIAAVTKKA